VLHLAARTHARRAARYAEANVEGTRRLLDAAGAAGVSHFLLVSTRAVSVDGGAYSVSKRHAESLVRQSGLSHTIVRLPEVYGAGATEGVDAIIARARRGAAIPLVGRGSDEVCPVHVDDVVSALAAALERRPEGKTYTIAGECMTLRQFVHRCRTELGSTSRVMPVPAPVVAGLCQLARLIPLPLYPDQLRRLRAPKPGGSREVELALGFTPRPLSEGLRDTRAS
jgi:NADH dehydrogenase